MISDQSSSRSTGLLVIGLAGLVILAAVVIFFLPVLMVSPGEVAVPVRFGAVQDEVLQEGFHVVDPFSRFPRLNIQRNILEMSSGGGAAQATGGSEVVSLSADQLPMVVDVGFPYALNPESAAKVYQRIGDDAAIDRLIRPAARTAVRDAVARFSWEDAAAHKREQVAALMGERFRQLIEADLQALGFSPAQAQSAFSLPPVQLRRILPPQTVQDAIAEKLRAQQDLEKQATLTQIAQMEAERRASEGTGLARLFGELPKGYDPHQLAIVLNAMANKTRAEALLQAAQGQRVQTIIMEGGGGQLPIQINPAGAGQAR